MGFLNFKKNETLAMWVFFITNLHLSRGKIISFLDTTMADCVKGRLLEDQLEHQLQEQREPQCIAFCYSCQYHKAVTFVLPTN